MSSILNSHQGMSFEERSDAEEEEGILTDDGSSSIFQSQEQQQHHVLISSTNDIAMFTEVPNYKTIHTSWLGLFMLLLTIAVFIISTIVPFACDRKHLPVNHTTHAHHHNGNGSHNGNPICFMKPVSLLLYIQCGMWAIFLICDQFIRYEHIKIRRRGYINFFNECQIASQLPFWIVSTFNTLLLAVSTVLHDHCKSATECSKSIHLTRTEYLTICIGLESVVLIVAIAAYMYQVVRFNRSKVPPDVFRDDMASSATDFRHNSLGQMEEEVFQRQADLIQYFKDRNVILQKTVLHLHNRANAIQAHAS